jgi:hypothetical protein
MDPFKPNYGVGIEQSSIPTQERAFLLRQLIGERSCVPRRKELRSRPPKSGVARQHSGSHRLGNAVLAVKGTHKSADDARVRVGVATSR